MNPEPKTAAIDTATLNGRIRYAFGTVIMAKMPEGVRQTKVAKGMQMLWPHMSKDMEKVPEEQLVRAAAFIDVLLQMCLAGVPAGVDLSFEDYLTAVFEGKVKILPGNATIIEESESATA